MTDQVEPRKIMFVGENSVSDAIRCKLPAIHLSRTKYANVHYGVTDYRKTDIRADGDLTAVVFSRPHHDTLIMAYRRMGIPIIVDMDDDFHAIPESHPGYKFVGKGSQEAIDKLENCIYFADCLVVATEELKERMVSFRNGDYDSIHIIPNGWSSGDPHWLNERSIYKDRIIIGWGGTITHREDFQMCVQPIKKILREHPETMICIAGDPMIYNNFARVPEKQKLFIPMVPYDLYPITVSHWDILLAPLLNNHFNNAKSDIKLVDAGAVGIPFVASNLPVYQNSSLGGTLVSDDGWYDAIKEYVVSEETREELGALGKKFARTRDMIEIGELWKSVIDGAIKEKETDC